MNNDEIIYKKILCIDGGGIKGIFPATILTEIEKQIDGKIHEYFDLISGTSTGAIIAFGLALGYTAKELQNFYEKYGPEIFTKYKKAKNPISMFSKFVPAVCGSLYDSSKLEEALRKVFDGKSIGNCKTRVLIPSVNISTGTIHIFKTAHHDTLRTDYKVPIVDAVLSTSAAPVYLKAHQGRDQNFYIDGGIGANNPSAMAVVEGISKCGWNPLHIKLLSIGCFDNGLKLNEDKAKSNGRQYLQPQIVTDLFMNIESQYSQGMAKLLLGPNTTRYLRINYPDYQNKFDMDGATNRLINKMVGIATEIARDKSNELLKYFFNVKADKFSPIYKD